VQKIIAGISSKEIEGIDSVIILNLGALKKNERYGKRKYNKKYVNTDQTLGTYFEQKDGKKPIVRLFIDRIVNGWPTFLFKMRFFRDIAICHTLFHEIGHHLHKKIEYGVGDSEKNARKWEIYLNREYLFKKYWYLFILPAFLGITIRLVKKGLILFRRER
jgi:hypothetical protein